MIYSRLLVSRALLSKDGIICLTIDDSEIENVTSMMNDVFGELNHLATIIIKIIHLVVQQQRVHR